MKHLSTVVSVFMVATLVALSSLPACAQGSMQVSIPNRPFAIDPEILHPLLDGIFDVRLNDQIIGVFLRNEGTLTITNVSATASFAASSGIVLTDDFENFGDLEPGVPVLGFFRAEFGASTPDKHLLTLQVSGDSFNQVVARHLFVARSALDPTDPNQTSAFVPEGEPAIEIINTFGGPNLLSRAAPTSDKETVEYPQPFAGQLGPLPFGDPWWKVAGGVAAIGGFVARELCDSKSIFSIIGGMGEWLK